MLNKRLQKKYFAIVISFLLQVCMGPVGNRVLAQTNPPKSGVITDIWFDTATYKELAPGSDNFPTTWGNNGHIYTSWGDGGGFGGTNDIGRVSLGFARIENYPPSISTYNVMGGVNTQCPATLTGKSYGMLDIGGTLYADNINSQTLDDIQALLARVEADQQVLAGTTTAPVATASDSATLTDLYVLNQAAVNSLSIGSSIAVGTDMVIQTGAINTISSPLSIQSLASAPVEIMAGKLRIETNGDVTIAGNLNVAGAINSQSLTVKETGDSGFGKLISVVDAQGTEVASIDASGSASFNNISLGRVSGSSDIREAVDITQGATSVIISRTWETPPTSVIVTPSYNTTSWVTDISQNGFTINVAIAPDTPQKLFFWAVW